MIWATCQQAPNDLGESKKSTSLTVSIYKGEIENVNLTVIWGHGTKFALLTLQPQVRILALGLPIFRQLESKTKVTTYLVSLLPKFEQQYWFKD